MIRLLTLMVATLLTGSLYAQKEPNAVRPPSIMESQGKFLGKTSPLRDLSPEDVISANQRAKLQTRKPRNPYKKHDFSYQNNQARQLRGNDPVRQTVMPKVASPDLSVLLSQEGLPFPNGRPSDPTGDVGQNYYVQAVNASRFQIFNKDGSPATAPMQAAVLWSAVGQFSLSDPIVLYDQGARRWVIIEIGSEADILFAISDTPDPLGAYNVYSFPTPNFPDYPKIAMWEDSYVITTNEFGVVEQTTYFIDREEILAGAEDIPIQRIGVEGFEIPVGFFVGTPIKWTGLTPPAPAGKPMIVRLNDDAFGFNETDGVDIFEFDIDFDNVENTTFELINVPTASYELNFCSETGDGFECVPEPDSGALDGSPAIIYHQTHYRNFIDYEAIVMTWGVDANPGERIGGIRWTELRRDDSAPTWYTYQEGTFAPQDSLNRYLSSVVMNEAGDIALGYSTSSSESFVDLRITGRLVDDPLGVMTLPETVVAEGQATIGGSRYGDYAHMVVDPFNERSFWFTSEYPETDGVASRIVNFNLVADSVDLAVATLVSPAQATDSSATQSVTVAVRNVGSTTTETFDLSYRLDDGPVVSETVEATLLPDSTLEYTFEQDLDLMEAENYTLELVVSASSDAYAPNDTLRVTRNRMPTDDVLVLGLANPNRTICSTTGTFLLAFINNTSDTLISLTVTNFVNGIAQEPTELDLSTPPGNIQRAAVTFEDLVSGENIITTVISAPNGGEDENPANDTASTTIIVDTSLEPFVLSIDFEPFIFSENSWAILNEDSLVVSSGDVADALPNFFATSEVAIDLCLAPDGCYTLVFFDSFGDGLESEGYSITNEEGDLLAFGGSNFGFEQRIEFCTDGACTLDLTTESLPASGPDESDGVAFILPENTNPDTVLVSIDGMEAVNETVFDSLAPGTYSVVLTDIRGCEAEGEVTIIGCNLVVDATLQEGSIAASSTGGVGQVLYSIDDTLYTPDTQFPLPMMGDTALTVIYAIDEAGCRDSIVVGADPTSIGSFSSEGTVIIYPNPTDGVFKVEVSGLATTERTLPFEIYDAGGRLLQTSRLNRYGEQFFGHFTIAQHPAGVYYVRVSGDGESQLLRLVKQ